MARKTKKERRTIEVGLLQFVTALVNLIAALLKLLPGSKG